MAKAKADTPDSAIDGWGARLRSTMDDLGVTNEALADALRVSIGSVNKYLKSGGIGGDLLLRLADFLGVLPHWLLLGKGPRQQIENALADYVTPSCDSGKPPLIIQRKALAELGTDEAVIASTAQDSAYRSKIAPGTIVLMRPAGDRILNGALHLIEIDGIRLIRRLFYNPISKLWTLGVDDDDKQTITMPVSDFEKMTSSGSVTIIGEIIAGLGRIE